MRRVFVLFVLIFGGLTVGSAQPISKASYEKLIETAELAMSNFDYYNALDYYEQAYDENSDRALVPIIANLQYELRDYVKAERMYDRLFRRAEAGEFTEERFKYARSLKMNAKYPESVIEFQNFINETDDPIKKELAKIEIAGAEMAQVMPGNPQGVTVENIGKEINTPTNEYSPALTPDGNTLIFSSINADEVVYLEEDNLEEGYAKILSSGKSDKGWSKSAVLDQKINRPGFHNTNVALSLDGRRMYFTRSTLEGLELTSSKIFVSENGDGGWQGPNEVKGVNGEYLATHPAVGELFGKEVLFFVADMDGGKGGKDIYYATYEGEGTFGDPVNLGDVINTIGDEVTPHYHDGTLYFSSTGHPGIGGYDVFYSVWDGSRWSEPKNMGKSYNTSLDELYFRIDAEGYTGFLTSNREGGRSLKSKTCCDDIYSFTIAKLFADLVVGVFSEDKKPLLGATVELMETIDDTPGETKSQSMEKGNRFDFGLDLEKPYMVVASREGYYPDTFAFNTVGLKESKSYEHRFFLKMKPVPPKEPDSVTIIMEQPIVLENILYDLDDDRIRTEAESDLAVIKELMEKYPEMKIELGSHTDIRGNDSYNEDLSRRRAESARRWLVKSGIERSRITTKGYGETTPQTVNAKMAAKYDFLKEGDVLTEEFINALASEVQKEAAHELNRRTEFKITEGPTSITIETKRLKKIEETEKQNDRKSNIQATPDTSKVSSWSSLYGKKNLKGVPIMTFANRHVDLGKVKHGDKRQFDFEFVNKGDTDLIISIITACECTTTDYSTKPVKPGGKGIIKVTFDSTEKEESEVIDLTIMLENLDPDTKRPIIENLTYKYELIK